MAAKRCGLCYTRENTWTVRRNTDDGKEKQDAGNLNNINYAAEIIEEVTRCGDMCFELNNNRPTDMPAREALLGRVVTKRTPTSVIALSTPCWVLRRTTEKDKLKYPSSGNKKGRLLAMNSLLPYFLGMYRISLTEYTVTKALGSFSRTKSIRRRYSCLSTMAIISRRGVLS